MNHICAAIDLGSNNSRLIIAAHSKEGYKIIKFSASSVRVGNNIVNNTLSHKAVERTIHVIQQQSKIMFSFHPKQFDCVCTAAFRIASKNANSVLNQIYKLTKLKFRIIEPDEEIYFSALGCSEWITDNTWVVDMGGCSSEIALCRKINSRISIIEWMSLPYGLFNFQDIHFKVPIYHHWTPLYLTAKRYSTVPSKIILSRSAIVLTAMKEIFGETSEFFNKFYDKHLLIKEIHKLHHLNPYNLRFLTKMLSILPSNSVMIANSGVKEGLIKNLIQQDSDLLY